MDKKLGKKITKKPAMFAPTKKPHGQQKDAGLRKSHFNVGGRKEFDDIKMMKKKKEEQLRLEELTNSRQHIIHLAKKSHFTTEQVEALIKIFKRLTSLGKLDRLRFREILYSTFEITDDIILDRTFGVFDGDSQGNVSETEWVLGLSAFLRGNLDEQIAYCYEVYDMNGDRQIGREEVYQFLQNCLSPIPGEGLAGIEPDEVAEGCRDIAELAMKKLDIDRNGVISYVDFHEAVTRDPLLLEALGPCLASTRRVKVFLSLFAEDYWNFSTNLSHPKDIAWDQDRNKFHRKKEILMAMMRRTVYDSRTSTAIPLLSFKDFKKMGAQSIHPLNSKESLNSKTHHTHTNTSYSQVKKDHSKFKTSVSTRTKSKVALAKQH